MTTLMPSENDRVNRFCENMLRIIEGASSASDRPHASPWHPRPPQEVTLNVQPMKSELARKLITAWHDVRSGLDSRAREKAHPWLTVLIEEVLRGVSFLPTLQLEPLPAGVSVGGMVVDAFRPLVDLIEEGHVDGADSIHRRYDQAIEAAIVGWDTAGKSSPVTIEDTARAGPGAGRTVADPAISVDTVH